MATTPALPVVLIAVGRDRSLTPVLGPNGYAVVEAATGARALERARHARPDIIILDAELPDVTGLEACRLFRGELHIGRNVPILLLTSGPPTPEQRVTALRAGVWDFLRHPGDRDELALKLATYVQAKRNIDATLTEGLVDPATGLHSRPGLARGSLAPKRIAYTTDALQILAYLPSLDDLLSQMVTGQLQHFSEYAVAW